VAPPLLAVVLAVVLHGLPDRFVAASSLGSVGVGFVVVKALPAGAAAASAAWSLVTGPSVVRADPTDLFALPALGLAWWTFSNARRQTRPTLGRIGIVVVLPLATLAVAATSAPHYPDAIAVTVLEGKLVVGEGEARNKQTREPTRWNVSEDAGRTWRRLDGRPVSTSDALMRQACVPDEPQHCYATAPGHLRVDESVDGGKTWQVSWEVSDDRRDLLRRAYDDLGDVRVYLSSNALAVLAMPGGHVVVVANGRDGYARRDASGTWERIGFGTTIYEGTPYPSRVEPLDPGLGLTLGGELVLTLLAGGLVVGVAAWLAARRKSGAVLGFTIVFGFGVASMALAAAVMLQYTTEFVLLGAAMAGVGFVMVFVGAVGMLLVAAASGALPSRWAMLVAVLGLLTTGGAAAVLRGWADGVYPYRVGALAALVVAVAGIATAGWLGHRFGRQTG
jgi:hypothetical protein